MLQKDCLTGRTLPLSVSTEVTVLRAKLWERRAGAGGLLGGFVLEEGDVLVPWTLLIVDDSNESRARDNEEDLFKESRLELLRGKDLFNDSLPLLSFPPLLLILLLLLLLLVILLLLLLLVATALQFVRDRLLLPRDSRLDSRPLGKDFPPV